ncbi:MAG: hypothetical protein DRR42_19510 [Gammaproteobacteria bacterium]|nr:MAG: hypothetical protein DRR42_19510 [Gammaproteobacteria bacterium]
MKPFTKMLIIFTFWTSFSFADENETLVQVAGEDAENYWVIKKVTRPSYPRAAALEGVEGCAAIAFVIETNGSTSSHRPLVGYPSEVFLKPSISAIKKWRFSSTESNVNKQPVYTFQVIEFSLSKKRSQGGSFSGDICKASANKSFNTDTGDAGAG